MYYTYILFSKRNGTLYIGVTSDLVKRVYQHKNKLGYFEVYENIEQAILREKKMKNLYRKEKIALIEKNNSDWNDLYDRINKL